MNILKTKNVLKKLALPILVSSMFLVGCQSSIKQAKLNSTTSNVTSASTTNRIKAPQKSFMWGVSTAGYQAEGYDNTSNWYNWDILGKTVHRNAKGTDFYNRYKEDLDLAKGMGVNGFRFSIEWSRVEPRKGYFDPQAIKYYKNVLKAAKDRGMTPVVTLVHFTYPQWLMDKTPNSNNTGLENPEFIQFYLRYVDRVVQEFGPDVKYWITFNEPNIWVPLSYLTGSTPPGKHNPLATVRAYWNVMKAHSKAYDLIHRLDSDSMVSSNVYYLFVQLGAKVTPSDDANNAETFLNSDWFYDTMETGKFPINPDKIFDKGTEKVDSQVGLLKKFDYIAFDYYYRYTSIKEMLDSARPWLVPLYPEGLYDAIMYYHRKYKKPILIAENGMATEDLKPRSDGWNRSECIVSHVYYMEKAIADGANVIGYYHWSITDNYEWGQYTPRFGLYSINVLQDPTMKRVPTPAVDVYKNVIKNNGVTSELMEKYFKM